MGGGPDLKKRERLLIVLPVPPPTPLLDRLKARFPHVSVEYAQQGEMWMSQPLEGMLQGVFEDKTIVVTFHGLPRTLDDAPKLELLHLLSAGSNHIQNHPIYTDSDITITTSSGIHGPQIAEWVLMTTLVRTHMYDQFHDAQKEHRWSKYRRDQTVQDMVGQRLGVLGYGSIGRQVGRVGKAIGMDVIAYTATPKDTPAARRDHGFIVPGTGDPDGSIPSAWFSGLDKASLHAFLAQDIDVLLVSVPLTAATLRFLGAEEFGVLAAGSGEKQLGHGRVGAEDGIVRVAVDAAEKKKKPFLVNISRGQIVDQPALVAALHDGTLSGAALDVTDPEPLPPDDPLWSAPNVTITPHISSQGVSYMDRSFQILEENLARKEKGEKLLNVVDRKRGY